MTQITVDNETPSGRNMLPGVTSPIKTIDIDSRALSSKIQKAVTDISESLRDIANYTPGFKLGEITFTLAITGSGEVSLMSVLKASGSVQTGIQIKLQPT